MRACFFIYLILAVTLGGAKGFAGEAADADLRLRFAKYDADPSINSSYQTLEFRGRAGLNVNALDDSVEFRFEPQFSSINYIPHEMYAPNSDTAAFYQLWGEYKWNGQANVKVGRQELVFGSERVLGNDDWGSYGRIFDAARVDLFYTSTSLALFYSRIDQTGSSINVSGGTDAFDVAHDFYGAYLTFRPKWADAIDLYVLNDVNPNNSQPLNLTTYGARVERRSSRLFVEIEATGQSGSYAGDYHSADNQIDIEAGPSFDIFNGLDLTLEYARATRNYNQLYPSPHEFLGSMDYFGRRNIEDMALHARLRVDHWRAELGLHRFRVTDTSNGGTVYKTDGASPISGGDSTDLGTEISAVLEKKWVNMSLNAGLDFFFPGQYFNVSGQLDQTTSIFYFEGRHTF
jgi:Alginate export